VGLNLHTHLEGWVRPETAADLARAMGLPAPAGGWDAALRMREPADLTAYLGHVAAAYPVLGSAESMRRVAREAVEDAAADGCAYLELRFGPSTHARPGFAIPAVIDAACAGLAEGSRATGLPVGLVVCLLRHLDDDTNLAVARAAADAAGRGVVGLDVAGDELLYPALERYREPYGIAAAAGLGLTAHAAEAGPAGAAVEAVELLGVRRIGHGSHIVDDPAVLSWAAREGIAIEVCLTSNVLTGAARSIAEHPLRRFVAAGCRVVLGDDNPVNIGTRLSAEEGRLVSEAGLTEEQVRDIHRTACEVAFTDEATRASLRRRFGAEASGQA
jgi:adenosine deaminase